MANEAILNLGTELVLAATGTTAAITNGAVVECTDSDRAVTDNAGYTLGIFEFDCHADGFSAAPTAGARINVYEQKYNSDVADAPDVATTYLNDYIGTFIVAPSDTQQKLSLMAPIHRYGGKYWVRWIDGGAGTASVAAGWALRLIPVAYGT